MIGKVTTTAEQRRGWANLHYHFVNYFLKHTIDIELPDGTHYLLDWNKEDVLFTECGKIVLKIREKELDERKG